MLIEIIALTLEANWEKQRTIRSPMTLWLKAEVEDTLLPSSVLLNTEFNMPKTKR
jgi:hypothetical protein